MRMPILNCNRCGKEDTMMVDAPRLDDQRVYCIECYAILFPPGWTDEYQPIEELRMEEPCEHEFKEINDGMAQCIFCGVIED